MSHPAKRFAAPLLCVALAACVSLPKLDEANTLDAYKTCAAADVFATTFTLSNGAHELNPLTRALFIKPLGHVAGTIVPLIGLSIAGYYILKAINRPAVTAAAAGLTCLTAARNLYVLP